MPDKEYATAVGFVQFDVNERELTDGQTVRDATIRTPGTSKVPGGGQLIRITIWPEYADVDINKGDFIAADGQLEVREQGGKTFVNLNSVSRLVVVPALEKAERKVANKKKTF